MAFMAGKRRTLSRILVVLLLGSIVALFVRSCGGGEEHLVDFTDLEVEELYSEYITVREPVTLEVHCIGSFQTDNALGAYGWIVDLNGGEPVWRLEPASAERSRGALAEFSGQIQLEPGTYGVHYSSYGDPELPRMSPDGFLDRISSFIDPDFERWRTEESKWSFVVAQASGTPEEAVNTASRSEHGGPDPFWETHRIGSDDLLQKPFHLERPSTVNIRATGEINAEPLDYAWVIDLRSGEPVWTMNYNNTVPAGGSDRNRRYAGQVKLESGLYMAGFESDDHHGPDDWDAHPPYNPDAWGMAIFPESDGAIASFDPWEQLPVIAEVARVGNDEMRGYGIQLSAPLRVWVEAIGEGRSSMYDHGWIWRKGDDEPLWRMTVSHSVHAGGDAKNLRASTALDLPAGKHAIFFETDDSHAYDDWNADPPDHPERYGITVFSLDEERVPAGRTLHADYETGEVSEAVLVSLRRLGNEQTAEERFFLEEEGEVSIVAVGEILLSGRYDYGWITRGDEIVWEMTRENTVYAGGARKNRMFEGTITLPEGNYTAHFVTDDSHAFDEFNDDPPDDPSAWGIDIRSLAIEQEEREWEEQHLEDR